MKGIVFALLLIMSGFASFAQTGDRLDTAKYFDFVEVMPLYKGDVNMAQLAPDIMSHIKRTCPIPADSSKILIHFIVETDGTVKKAVVLKGICDEMNKQALEDLKKLKFTPGQQQGKKVRVKSAVMLKFKN